MTEALGEDVCFLCSGEGDIRRRSEGFCRGKMQWEVRELPMSCAGENHHPLIITPKWVKKPGIPRDTPGFYLAKGVGRNKVPSQAQTTPTQWQSPSSRVCQGSRVCFPSIHSPLIVLLPSNDGLAFLGWQQAAKLHIPLIGPLLSALRAIFS